MFIYCACIIVMSIAAADAEVTGSTRYYVLDEGR